MNIIQTLREMVQAETSPETARKPETSHAKTQLNAPDKFKEGAPKSPSEAKAATSPIDATVPKAAAGADGEPAKKDSESTPPAKSVPLLIPEGTKAAEWKNKPAREDWCPPALADRFPEIKTFVYEDNYSVERLLDESWRVAGATRRGRLHAHQGTHREDAFGFQAGPNFVVLCVSDGAGSAKLSRLGSHVAVTRVTEFLHRMLAQPPPDALNACDKLSAWLKTQVSTATQSACLTLRQMALEAQAPARDLRCTLLTAVRCHFGKHEIVAANQIGDGAIVALFKDKTVRRIGAADAGEFSGEVACFVPDDCADKKALDVQVLSGAENLECLLLCSDGVEDPFYPIEKKAASLFQQLYTGVTEKLPEFSSQPAQGSILGQDSAGWALGQWLGFEKRGENDDRSVLLLHRYPPNYSS